ncbi:MAG: segregation/condensation protein A [Candidatus Omnitrophica bacterium]|nr:segregation/condensation protein A [Candidatus Omnitrophota bacterium]
MSYKVKLEIFEGPLDLLLYLIKKSELNIEEIPISTITDQYLQYLELMKMLDLEIAGEFLVMAATLMHIKSKMLLPPEESEGEEEEEQDPRDELVKKLLEYKKFKEAAERLKEKEAHRKEVFARPAAKEDIDTSEFSEDELYFEANIFDLLSAFSKVLKEVPRNAFYEVVKDESTVSEKIHEIFHLLVKRPTVYFLELFKRAKSKMEIIATFLALLELIRMKEILIRQDKVFGDIKIEKNTQRITPPKIKEGEDARGEQSEGPADRETESERTEPAERTTEGNPE